MKKILLAGVSILALATAASSAQADVFNYTGTIVDYTVPTTGLYEITAFGAQGGFGRQVRQPKLGDRRRCGRRSAGDPRARWRNGA